MALVKGLIPDEVTTAKDAAVVDVERGRPSARLPRVHLHGMSVHAMTEVACVRHILDELDAGRGGWVVTPNLDHARRWRRDPDFADLCRRADLVTADGMPLVWASRLQGTPLPERVAGSNLIDSLSRAAADRGRSVFLLGGDEGVAEEAADVLKRRYPTLRIAGTHYPPFGFEHDRAQSAAIVESVTKAAPDIVFVAVGSPKQERLIAQLRPLLPQTWWLGVGISFSFLADRVKRAPRWMQRMGLEWVHRLAQEPRRLGRRYLVEGMPFATTLLAASTWRGMKHGWNVTGRRREIEESGSGH